MKVLWWSIAWCHSESCTSYEESVKIVQKTTQFLEDPVDLVII